MGTLFVDNIKQQSSQGSGTITIGASGETVALASGVVQSNLNYPAFEAYVSSSQNLSDAAETKVQFDTERFDTNSMYDASTNYRWTPTVAGKYVVYTQLGCDSSGGAEITRADVMIYKNGSQYVRNRTNIATSTQIMCNAEATIDFVLITTCLLYTSPSPRDLSTSRMPSSA